MILRYLLLGSAMECTAEQDRTGKDSMIQYRTLKYNIMHVRYRIIGYGGLRCSELPCSMQCSGLMWCGVTCFGEVCYSVCGVVWFGVV